jgi:hypothetical protein
MYRSSIDNPPKVDRIVTLFLTEEQKNLIRQRREENPDAPELDDEMLLS